MTKNKKIEYINQVYLKFKDARNHGYNGNNWWHPKPDVIAYNVKMHAWPDFEALRAKMTARQNEYYTDEDLDGAYWGMLHFEAEQAIDEIKDMGAHDAWFAGRSGGWLEVEYNNNLEEVDATTEDIDHLYQEAKKLDQLEGKVADFIKERHKSVNTYVKSDDFITDFIKNELMTDEVIGEIYKDKAERLLKKLK